MKASVYIDTSVISYLTARPSRDLLIAGRQTMTQRWWDISAGFFDIYTSQLVRFEASTGDAAFAASRLAALEPFPNLEMTPEANALSDLLMATAAVPRVAQPDSLHIAICAVHGIDFLMTWDFKHLANARLRLKINESCESYGVVAPVICTPEELIEVGYET